MRTKKVKKQKVRDRLQRERRDSEIRKNEMVKRLLSIAKDDGFEINYKLPFNSLYQYVKSKGITVPLVNQFNYILQAWDNTGILSAAMPDEIVIDKPPKRKKGKIKNIDDQRRKEYDDYLNSPEWRSVREKVFEYYGRACVLCDSTLNLEVHHKHYKTFKNETVKDCVPLCLRCHKRHHKK